MYLEKDKQHENLLTRISLPLVWFSLSWRHRARLAVCVWACRPALRARVSERSKDEWGDSDSSPRGQVSHSWAHTAACLHTDIPAECIVPARGQECDCWRGRVFFQTNMPKRSARWTSSILQRIKQNWPAFIVIQSCFGDFHGRGEYQSSCTQWLPSV